MLATDKPQPSYTNFMRGGRMVKIKGLAASIAPMLGAAVLFTGLSASVAQAANECGTEAVGPDTMTCAASVYSNGITYTDSDGLSLTLDNPAIATEGTGVTVSSDAVSGDVISVNGSNFDTITTVGTNTEGNTAISVNLTTGYIGGASIILGEQAGTITTTGRSAGAIIASGTSGPGDLLIEMHGGDIFTDGFQANALQLFQSSDASASTGDLTIRMTGGTILAEGDSSDGITTNNRGLGDSFVEITGGSIEANVTSTFTNGNFANGVSMYNLNSDAENFAEVRMSGGRIDVNGPNSHGILLQNAGTGDSRVTVTGNSVVNVAGPDSFGIFVRNGLFLTQGNRRAGTFDILVDGTAVVTGGSGNGSAILIGETFTYVTGPRVASISGTIEVGAGATVDGSASGVSIRDFDFSSLYDGTNTTMIIKGTLLGDILAGLGDDSVNIADDANIADVDLIDGGGSDADQIAFSNWSGSDAASRSDATIIDLDGALIGNMEEVFLSNGSDVTFGGVSLSNASDNGLLFEVEDASTARFADDFEIDGDVNNFGALDLSAPNLIVGTALTVTGDYAAASDLFIDVDLSTGGGTDNNAANDAAFTDQFFILGNAAGTTDVFVNNVGGAGVSTDLNENGLVDNNEGLLFAQVSGTAAADSFALGAPAAVGAFALDIFSFDPVSSDSGLWDFVLALTDAYSPSVPVYEALPLALQGMQSMPSLQQRVGNRHWAGQPTAAAVGSDMVFCKDPAQNFRCAVTPDQSQVFADAPRGAIIEGSGAWVRIDGLRSEFSPESTNAGISVDETVGGIEAGIDHQIFQSEAGDRLIGGISLRYAQSGVDVSSEFGDGNIETNGFGLGAALTWYDTDGLYVDAQARAMWTNSDLGSGSVGPLAEGVEGFGYGVSVEVGKEIAMSQSWNLTPQAQLAYTNLEAEDFTGPFATVTDIKAESLVLRAGVVASNEVDWEADNGTTSRRAFNVGFHVTQEMLSESRVLVSGTPLKSEKDDTIGEISLGGTYSWNDEKYSLYGQVSAASGLNSFGDSNRVGAMAGFRIQW